jgi:hypothetical protein
MSSIFLLVTDYEFMPNYNLAPIGILILEYELIPIVIRIALSPLHVFEKCRPCFAHAEEHFAGGFGGGFIALVPQMKALS